MLLRRLELLLGGRVLSQAEITRLTQSFSVRRYSAGEVITHHGTSEDYLAVLTKGHVSVYPSPGGDPHASRTGNDAAILVLPGSIFGEENLRETTAMHSIRLAVTDTDCWSSTELTFSK